MQLFCIVVHRGKGIPGRTGSRVYRKKIKNKPYLQSMMPNYLIGGNLTTFYIVAKNFHFYSRPQKFSELRQCELNCEYCMM
jgi:hypothetical protein